MTWENHRLNHSLERLWSKSSKHSKDEKVMGNQQQAVTYRKEHSTDMMSFYEEKVDLDRGKAVDIIYFDSSRAFNNLPQYPDQPSHRGMGWIGDI